MFLFFLSKTDRVAQAVDFYKKSLRLNPFMWSSFEAVCNIGEKIEPAKYFTINSALNAYKNQILDQENINPAFNLINQQQQQQQQQQNQLNILKQIDQHNDLLDQKSKQDIAQILRLVETDQQNKLNKHKHHHHHHHPNCLSEQQIGNSNQTAQSSTTSNNVTTTTTTTTQTNETATSTTTTNTNTTYNYQQTRMSISNASKQTPLINQVLQNSFGIDSIQNPTTSLQTPPQFITNNLTIAPPLKKVSFL